MSTSLALAASVTLDKTDYSQGDLATINVACTGDWLARILNPEPQLVHIDQGQNSKSITYNTLSSSASGKYAVTISCQDGTSSTKNFCVNAPGCTAVAPAGGADNSNTQTGGSNTGAGGSGGGCIAQWSCGQWGYCNATLQQGRTCSDISGCGKSLRMENTSCPMCQQSWICSLWSECQSGTQVRACIDEHYCNLATLKPTLQKSCSDSFALGPDPAQIINIPPQQFTQQYPQAVVPPIVQQPQSAPITGLWDQYKVWIIGAGASLVLIAIIVTVILVLHKPKEKAYNFDELKDWIHKEREMGTSDADVRQILKEQTGWRDDEIVNAFKELR